MSLQRLSKLFRLYSRSRPRSWVRYESGTASFLIQPDLSKTYSDPARNPAQLFPRTDVQHLLRTISRYDTNKIFKLEYVKAMKSPNYKFMTTEEVEEAKRMSYAKAKSRLLMPPVMTAAEDKVEVLAEEPEIIGHEPNPIIITDISVGRNDRDRMIVVREPNGVLRTVNRDERNRMNHTWFPIRDRQIEEPPMFLEENMEPICRRKDYTLILDRACLQFEPDHPRYLEVTSYVYEYLLSSRDFDLLRSTRHFGPMAFYYAYHQKADELMCDMLNAEQIREAADLARLCLIATSQESKLAELQGGQSGIDEDLNQRVDYQLVEHYIENMAKHRHPLRVALDKHYDLMEERKQLDQVTREAHGGS